MCLLTRSLLLALLLGVGAFADEWTKAFTVSGNPEIRVETGDGSVTVRAWDEHRIAARVTTSGWKIGPDEVTVREFQTGDQVRIVVQQPHRYFNFGLGSRWIRIELQGGPLLSTILCDTDQRIMAASQTRFIDP